ncbi:LasR-specific antiactivator QslA [Pseudomonas nitroreducens]|uniref:LasR-specific antiactivator QslA n=1 Tax=Pseudomonas nitroreducens TaxID=46680 RepID=UPI0026591BE4|nr:LasR-specific antiactivator QslA [Pseudomonas nitroreducens]MCP1649339.1 hypothetical protein [Pseudomonas nitroreducens]MCP1684700.1 hypothetical protein [Pseudomonas nitroreducens]
MSSDNNTLDPESTLLYALSSDDVPLKFEVPPGWPEESLAVMTHGAQVAREWLLAPRRETLWVDFAKGRTVQKDMLDRMAYEIGFLTHLQQQLEQLPH